MVTYDILCHAEEHSFFYDQFGLKWGGMSLSICSHVQFCAVTKVHIVCVIVSLHHEK